MDQETIIQDPMDSGAGTPALELSRFDRDDPTTWADAEIYQYPDYDVEKFQKKLNDLFGLSETGLPIVRLVWPGDIKKCYSKFYTAWDTAGFGTKTELRAKYLYASIQIPGTSDTIDVPPPRWILEQFNHPGQYLASWEQVRFDRSGREVRPAPPPNGYYSHLWTIAKHTDQVCCKAARAKMKVCWGSFRHPDEADIEMLRQAKQARDADREIDTTKPLDERTIESINRETEERIAMTDELVEEHVRGFVDENAYEMLEFFTGRKFSDKARKMFSIPESLKGKHKINTTEIQASEIIAAK